MEGSLRLHPRHTPRTLAGIAGAARAIRRLARDTAADVIHANSFRAGLAASFAARLGARRPLVHLHDCLPSTASARATEQVLSRSAATILANSSYTAACFNGGRSRAPVAIVHNPIDLDRFQPEKVDRAEARAELGLDPDQFVIAVLAQITPWKGQDTALEATGVLRDRGLDVHLVLAGEVKFRRPLTRYDNDAFLRDLRDSVRFLGLEDAVSFTGDCADPPRLLRAVDCVLMPSWAEPWGRVVVEAMAMGTPVIATSVGGPTELVEDGRNGLLAVPRNPAAWADAVHRVMTEPGLRDEMVTAGRETARRFSRDAYVERILGVYRESVTA
jgi:glycosyltransferase involved in cell wall biosynthesis